MVELLFVICFVIFWTAEPGEPKTYKTKDKFEYFKPSLQVVMDNSEKPGMAGNVTEIYVRGDYTIYISFSAY